MTLPPGVAGATKDRSKRTRPRASGTGAISVGCGPDGTTWRRHKVSGRTGAEVAAKLGQPQAEDSVVQPEHGYTVQRAVDDWLAERLDGRSVRTVRLNHDVLKLVTAIIGNIELRKLTTGLVNARPWVRSPPER
jgi:hypothetical protein